jgi:two-component SAPR family response regulator
VRIFTLGRFEVEIGGEVLRFDGKAKRKPLELLQALVALGPAEVTEADLVEALWPDAEGDAGQHALETTAYRLRKLLGQPDLVQQRERRLSHDRGRCWVDVEAIEKVLRRAAARAPTSADADGLRALAEEGVALYRGPFLPGEDERPWVHAHRERTRGAMRRLVAFGASALEAAGRQAEARALERRAAEADPELLRGSELASA